MMMACGLVGRGGGEQGGRRTLPGSGALWHRRGPAAGTQHRMACPERHPAPTHRERAYLVLEHLLQHVRS